MKYTKAQLEELVCIQLENLNAIHDLLRIIKLQNELLEKANEKLDEHIGPCAVKPYNYKELHARRRQGLSL